MSADNHISAIPRWMNSGHVDVAIHCALADLAVQVARIANALEYQLNIDPTDFPDTSNKHDLYGGVP